MLAVAATSSTALAGVLTHRPSWRFSSAPSIAWIRCTRIPLRDLQQRFTTDTSTSAGGDLRRPHTKAADWWLMNARSPHASKAASSKANGGSSPEATV